MPGGPEGVQQAMEYSTSLTEQYYKARKQLVLWSAFLFAWELVGINVDQIVIQGASVENLLKSPQAVPWILVVLVFYFGFQTVLEWMQCPAEAVRKKACQVHFGAACVVAVGSMGLYIWQTMAGIQIADKVVGRDGIVAFWVTVISFAWFLVLFFLAKKIGIVSKWLYLAPLVLFPYSMMLLYSFDLSPWKFFSLIIVAIASIILAWFIYKEMKRAGTPSK